MCCLRFKKSLGIIMTTLTLETMKALLKDELLPITKRLDSLDLRLDSLEEEFNRQSQNMSERMGRLERNVQAIESMPQPVTRHRVFHSATELHSVSGARRSRQGYMG
jgi:predicted  nucleic acid-binding Zn-ribbon protein